MKLNKKNYEDGAAELIEAAIIYPIVIFFVFLLVYVGLYLLQLMSLSAYAQKVALLASREIAYPGYIGMVSKDNYSTYSDSSVEGDENLISNIEILNNPTEIDINPYRYFTTDIEFNKSGLETIMKNMIKNNSVIAAKNEVKVHVDADNYFVVQYVTVDVEQTLIDFPALEFFGLESPKISTSAKAAVNDTDEFIRNVDFVSDALGVLAKKLGIDVQGIKEKINDAATTLGLK